MSTPESELDLELLFLPAWAQEPATNRFAKFETEPGPPREESGDRPRRRSGPGGPGGRDRGDRRDRRPPPGGRQDLRRGDRPDRGPGGRRPERSSRPQPPREPEVVPEIEVSFLPEEKGVDSLARQIKLTGRAYPLFGIAAMILKKPERHSVTFSVIKKADGTAAQPLFVCAIDDTLWLSEANAIQHIFKRHFELFYRPEKIPTEPPKGIYTFVAQCGMSGVILGPPNYHDYQNKLVKLHNERFSRMPFDVFKARVRIVRDEAVVKQWLEEQSSKTEYHCLNIPEPKKLTTRDEVEAHFREVHLPNVVKAVESFTTTGANARLSPELPLRAVVRRAWEEQQRFPIKLATLLSQQFASRGLQFFKVNKTITHVSVARPRFLDTSATPVSAGVKRIVEFINATPNCTRRKLLDALAPGTAAPEGADPAAAVSPEATAVNSDLHWLIHEGHVIEFAHGILEMAKAPPPRPTRPPPAAAPAEPAEPADPAPTPATGENDSTAKPEPAASHDDAQATAEPTVESSSLPAETRPNDLPAASPAEPAEQIPVPASASASPLGGGTKSETEQNL